MKKLFMIICVLCLFSSISYALSIYDPISDKEKLFPDSTKEFSNPIEKPKMMFNGDVMSWISDINANKGHVTYTLNVQIPLEHKNDILIAGTRRDYICSQSKEAILWGKARYASTGEIIDYTPFIDKTKYKKYVPVEYEDTERIDQIEPYCDYDN